MRCGSRSKSYNAPVRHRCPGLISPTLGCMTKSRCLYLLFSTHVEMMMASLSIFPSITSIVCAPTTLIGTYLAIDTSC